MRLKAEQLSSHLAKGQLAPVYLISGDEPLLVQEAADTLRLAARSNGYTERELFHVEAGFDWNRVLIEANSLSLFAEKKILEIRISNGKPDNKGVNILQEYLANPNDDTLLLIITPKLEAATNRSKWVKAIEARGVTVQLWPVTTAQLPRWIGQRLKLQGIKANSQAINILAERVEGNLLAAIQEIEKLKLLVHQGELDGDTMSTLIADSARYNVFTLVDKMLLGEAQNACRTLRGLREEGTEATIILWAITRELRTTTKATEALAAGDRLDSILNNLGVWEKRKPLIKSAIRRLPLTQLHQMLKLAGGIDRAIKGIRPASPWDDLTTLILMFCGVQTLHPSNLRQTIQAQY